MSKLNRKVVIALVAVAAMVAVSCNDGPLDNGSGPDVVVTVEQMTIPPISGAISGMSCVFTITEANANLLSQPKSDPADNSPFNDTVIESVTIDYTWDDGALSTPDTTFQVAGTVPVGGSATIRFPPIAAGDLSGAFAGHTASLNIVFTGTTVSGQTVTVPAGGALTINDCI